LPSILINGHPTAQLSVLDRGFQYGDGLFETLRIDNGQPQHWSRHMARLVSGCERLGIDSPDLKCLRTEAESLCRTFMDGNGDLGRGVLKITVTRGSGGRGYAFTDELEPTRVLALSPAPVFPVSHASQGVKLRLCEMRLGQNQT
jgi:4-amino-4-deoxychorismate lyase